MTTKKKRTKRTTKRTKKENELVVTIAAGLESWEKYLAAETAHTREIQRIAIEEVQQQTTLLRDIKRQLEKLNERHV